MRNKTTKVILLIVSGVACICCHWYLSSGSNQGFLTSFKRNLADNEPGHRMVALRDKIRVACKTDPLAHVIRNMSDFFKDRITLKSDKYKLFYFPIPKVGSNFWKRMWMSAHANEIGRDNSTLPSGIEYNRKGVADMVIKDRDEMKRLSTKYTSFVFVRDPFARLFSAYIDKMYLPQQFTKSNTEIFRRCALGMSFSDFLQQVSEIVMQGNMGDGHFYPMWIHCNPCEMNLSYVGKMENYMEDVNYILSTVGIDIKQMMATKSNESAQKKADQITLKVLIQRTFGSINERLCLSKEEIVRRLWSVLHIRGFLSKHQQLAQNLNLTNVGAGEFLKKVFKAFDENGPKKERSAQREEAMMEAYSLVPKPTLMEVAKAFGTDCRIFDYNCNIEQRFLSQRKQNKPKFYF